MSDLWNCLLKFFNGEVGFHDGLVLLFFSRKTLSQITLGFSGRIMFMLVIHDLAGYD